MARPKTSKQYLISKYQELVWALSLQDGYSAADIGIIMNRHRSVITRAIAKRPKDWTPKWVKAQ